MCSSQKLAISRVENSAQVRSLPAGRRARKARALLLQNLDQPAQQRHQPLAGADCDARRNERFGSKTKWPEPSAHDPRHRQRDQITGGFGIEQQVDILAPHLHRFFVAPGGFVVQHLDLRAITQAASPSAVEAAPSPSVRVLAPSGRRGATASITVTVSRAGGNRSAMLRGFRQRVAFRHLKDHAVRENAARMEQGDRAVLQRFDCPVARPPGPRARTTATTWRTRSSPQNTGSAPGNGAAPGTCLPTTPPVTGIS